MNPTHKIMIAAGMLFYAGIQPAKIQAQANSATLIKAKAITLPQVKGSFDLMAYDSAHGRLFLSAQDNHSVEVFNLKNQTHLKSLPGFQEPKWVFYHPRTNVLYVATGLDGKVTAVNAVTYQTIKTYAFKEKCNNLRFDPATEQLFVGVGKTSGSIGIIDLKQQKITGEIPLAAYPKQFELTPERIYVNVPQQSLIQVIDRKTAKVIANWHLKCENDNVPMALDRIHQLLYIGCAGGQLLVCSAITGKELSRINIHKDVDGIYLDTKRSRLYVSCGEGFIDVLQVKQDKVTLLEKITTRVGAGTALFIPSADQYILAEPQTSSIPAAIQIYQPAK